ncbi:hypothetical protein M9458_019163, partial [Cirrhinus mrigala]
ISPLKRLVCCSFEELLKEEKTFWQEICTFEKKIDSWALPVKADGRPPPHADKPCVGQKSDWRNLPAEVTALETFLQQTGGRHGGWDEFDHQSFLKVWTKHSGKNSYRQEARLYLPGKTEEDVKLHEEWFLELRRLQDRKREVTEERELRREQRDEDEEPREDETRRLKQEERRREASQKTQQREEEREQRLRDEILRRRRAKEERRRQLEVKLLVEAHVQQKKEQEELRLLEEEAQEQRQAAEGIRRFQERVSGDLCVCD